jgi:alpha-tubulin suppressor-like RCC1 family protein
MTSRPAALRSFQLWALAGALLGCSSGDTSSASTGSDAGDQIPREPDASIDASIDAADGSGGPVTPPSYDFAVRCTGAPCVTQIAARGGGHACALLADRSVRCWGSNDSGQLGTGATDAGASPRYEPTPKQVRGIANATGVTAAGHGISGTTCVVSGSGDVACFGSDAWGQLGRASGLSNDPHPDPEVIDGLHAKSVTLANTFALAVDTEDRLWSWGTNDASQLARAVAVPDAGPPNVPARAALVSTPVRSCAGTSTNGFVVGNGGDLLSWGGGTSNQLGRTSSALADPNPRAIAISAVTGVAAGNEHACAMSEGDVHCWGRNEHGQLGTGRQAEALLPARAVLPGSVYAVALAAGGNNTCIITSNGDLYCWGANESGQLGASVGRSQAAPTRIPGLAEQVVEVALMDEAICALLRGGSVACWGDNLLGQLGRGSRDLGPHAEAAPVVFQ